MKHLLVALALALAACAAPQPTPSPSASTPAAQTPAAAANPTAACAARGGEMQRICRLQSLQCVVRYADAGKPCRGKADCQGRCLAKAEFARQGEPAEGQCQATSNACGCSTLVENGRALATMCVD